VAVAGDRARRNQVFIPNPGTSAPRHHEIVAGGRAADDGKALMWSKLARDTLAAACVPLVTCLLSSGSPSAAPTAELAKKCAALTAKAFPARVIGNPSAGSAKGSGRAEQDYFNDCIRKGGNVDLPGPSEGTSTQPIPIPVPRPN
jgi:hypothetical protein